MLLIADLPGWGDSLSALHTHAEMTVHADDCNRHAEMTVHADDCNRHACMFSNTAHFSKHTAKSREAELVDLAGLRGCEAQYIKHDLLIADLSWCADSLSLLTCMTAEANTS